jgi:hypothetical protein
LKILDLHLARFAVDDGMANGGDNVIICICTVCKCPSPFLIDKLLLLLERIIIVFKLIVLDDGESFSLTATVMSTRKQSLMW